MGHLQTAVVNTEARLERLVQPGRESQRITPIGPDIMGVWDPQISISISDFWSFWWVLARKRPILRPDSESSRKIRPGGEF